MSNKEGKILDCFVDLFCLGGMQGMVVGGIHSAIYFWWSEAASFLFN
jgi:hypothetical protein